MGNLFSLLEKWAHENWHSPFSCLALVVSGSMGTTILFFGPDFWKSGMPAGIVGAIAGILIWLIWYFSTIPPKHQRGRVGIGVAIRCLNESQANLISTELVETIRKRANQTESEALFSVLEFPRRFVRHGQKEGWEKELAEVSRTHYLLYGQASQRIVDGKPVHALVLDGYVRHRPLPAEVSKEFSREFRSILPKRFFIGEDGDVFGLEIAGHLLHDVATYIVAMAAAYSGDFKYSANLFRFLSERFKDVEPEELGPLQIIKNAIPPRFVAVLDGQIRTCHNRYWSSGNKSHLKEAEPITQELLSVDPNHYGGRLIKGMCQFVLYRDIEGALETIESCNSVSECTWQYNAAFLKAYQKDLNGAYHYYSKAFSAPIVLETVPIQTEEFIHRVLQEEPNQSQLWFCLGLINYRDKGDLVAAKADFEKFLENTNPNEFELQHTTVVKWLKRINIRLQ